MGGSLTVRVRANGPGQFRGKTDANKICDRTDRRVAAGRLHGIDAGKQATQETLTTATATVETIDQTTRNVTLRDDADGSTFTVTAGPEVRNLEQVSAGDHVRDRLLPGHHRQHGRSGRHRRAQATAVVAGRAPEGAMPGAAAAVTDSMVVTVVSYDRNSGLATFRTPDGFTRRAVVPPELRNFANTAGPGSRVLVTMTARGGGLGHRGRRRAERRRWRRPGLRARATPSVSCSASAWR